MSFSNLHIKDIYGTVKYSPTITEWDAKNRKEHIIGIQLHGNAIHYFKDKKFVIKGNYIYFLNRKEDYRVKVLEQGTAISVHFTTYDEIDIESFSLSINNPDKIIQILEKIEKAKTTDENLKVFSLLYWLLNEYENIRNKVYFPKDKRIIEAKLYIDENFNKEYCLQNAIKNSNLSNRRFNDLFKSTYDITPNRYIVLKKITHAKELLSVGGISITAIAEMCGFSDVYYFSKVFKKETGIVPSKWKN